MFYSGYLSLYLLQFLNMKLSQTKLIQRAHTTIDGLIDDALFPENGPVFMQRFHEVHPVRRSSGEKIKRRFGESYVPETEHTIEAFNDHLINDPAAYDYPISTDTPIQILNKSIQSTGYMPIFDNANPYNRDNIMQGHNASLLNVYDDFKAIETTVQNDNINRKYKTDVTKEIHDIVMNPSATTRPILFEPYGPTFTPKMYDDYPTGSKSAQGFDFVLDGPDFNPKLYDENHHISREKSIQRYTEPLYEPSFTFKNFDVTRIQTTKIKTITRKFNRTVFKKIADVFYPELETTVKRSHRTRKGRFKQRPRFTNKKNKKKTGDAIKETTIKKQNIPLLNYLAFMQEQRNPRTRYATIQRFNELISNGPELMQNYDVNPSKIRETAIQRSHTTRIYGPIKHASKFEAKVNEHNYPSASDTTDFMETHDLNSLLTETAIQKLKRPLSNELSFIQRRQQNPTTSDKTIQRFNEPLRNGPDLILNVDVHHDLPIIKTATRKTKDQRFDGPLKYAPEFEAKMNEVKYPPALKTTDFMQAHDINSLKLETASQLLRGAPKHKPTYKKIMDVTYSQKSETTIQRLKKALRNEPDLNQKVNKNNYPPALETTDFSQNHDLNSPKIETASQPLRGAPKYKPTYKKVMDVTYPQKSDSTIQRFKKPLENVPDFDHKVNVKYYPQTLVTTDFKQSHDFNFPKIETASQPLRGTPKHKPTFIKETHETYPQKRETTIHKFKKSQKDKPYFDQKVNEYFYPPALETTDVRHSHDLHSPKIETESELFRESQKHKPTFNKVMEVTYPHKSEITIRRLKKPLRNGPDFDQRITEDNFPPALQTGPTIKQIFDVTVPQSGNYGVQRLTIKQSFPRASIFRPKIEPEMQKSYTMTNLVSPAYIRSTASHPPIAETAHPLGSNLESTVSYSPITELANPWVTKREVYRETSKSYYIPSNTLDYEVKPQVLRTPVPEPPQLEQETDTNLDEPTRDPMFAENFVPKQESQDETSEAEEDSQSLAESPESEEDSHILAASPESEEDEAIEKKEEYRGLTEKIVLNQEAVDVAEGEGTDPFSMFLRKLVKVLVSKNIKELRNLIQPFGRYVTTLVDSGKLIKLGISTGSFIAQSTPLLRAPVKQIQRYLFIAHVSLENRRRMLDDGTNTLLDELDDVYDAGEEEAMQRILSEITMYPNTSRSEEEIVKDLVDDIVLHPMHRMAGTTQGNVVFEYIGKFCNKYQHARRNAKPAKHSKDKGISTKNYSRTRGITTTEVEEISSKQDIRTRGVTSKEEEKNIKDSYSCDDSKYSNGERCQVEIRIRINRGKDYHGNKLCKSRKSCVKINKTNIRKIFKKDSNRSTTQKT